MRLYQRFGQILAIFAVLTAEGLYRRQLLFGKVVLALQDISLPQVLPHLRVTGIERDRLQIVPNAFVGAAQLAGLVATIVERVRGVSGYPGGRARRSRQARRS